MNSAPEQLIDLLVRHNTPYRLITHIPEGRTDLISEIRGNKLQEAAKALVVVAKKRDGKRDYFLAVVPGDCRISFDAISRFAQCPQVRMAPVEKAAELTGCVMGAVPPFSFHPELTLIVDRRLLDNEFLFFNAGRLDQSICMSAADYLEAAKPAVLEISTQ